MRYVKQVTASQVVKGFMAIAPKQPIYKSSEWCGRKDNTPALLGVTIIPELITCIITCNLLGLRGDMWLPLI
jgi:hypothetical protein